LTIRKLAVGAGLALLASCGPPPPPPAPPPLPPPAPEPEPEPEPIVIPSRPRAPGGATTTMAIPQVGADGIRMTVNAHLNPLEAVWNFRSGWNVAALNCLEPRYQPILDGYKAFLNNHARRLTAVNRALDLQYRRDFGSAAISRRESFNTQVYNYFALPPARNYFCEAALKVSTQMLAAPPGDIDAFALTSLPVLEGAFEQFFSDYERFKLAVADWDAQYGAQYGASQGVTYVSATSDSFSTPGSGRVPLSTEFQPASPVGYFATEPDIVDSLPADIQFVSQPVTQPTAGEAPAPGSAAGVPAGTSQPVVQAQPEDSNP
jgi:hypothetical protein